VLSRGSRRREHPSAPPSLRLPVAITRTRRPFFFRRAGEDSQYKSTSRSDAESAKKRKNLIEFHRLCPLQCSSEAFSAASRQSRVPLPSAAPAPSRPRLRVHACVREWARARCWCVTGPRRSLAANVLQSVPGPLLSGARLREGPAGLPVPPKLPHKFPAGGAQAAVGQATHFEHLLRHARAHNNVPFQQTSHNSRQAIIRHCPDRAYPHGSWQVGDSNNTLIVGGVVGCAAGGYYAYSSGMLDGDALPAGKASMSPCPDPCVRPGELLFLLGSSNRVTRTPRKMAQMEAPP
jgi:hypothetical protein